MNEISPLVLVFALFFASIFIVIAGVITWGLGQLKRERMVTAAKHLNEIVGRMNELGRTGSLEKQNEVNSLIDAWDKSFSRELGVEIIKLSRLV